MFKKLVPMGVSNVAALIDRTYRESHAYQWVREAVINSKEADATRIHFGVEWQGVQNKGVYRRLILDNGRGMPPDQLLMFLNTYGGSGKPIGGEHENFGHGFKTSTLPWNREGIVVVSKSIDDGTVAMLRLEFDQRRNEYGARLETVEGSREAVYAPYDATDTDGIDYEKLIPAEYPSGLAIVLMGSIQQPDSFLGAADRDEASLNGIARYLNERMWELHDLDVTIDFFNNKNRELWPKYPNDKGIPNTSTIKWLTRRVFGAKHYIEVERKEKGNVVGRVEHHGIVDVDGGLAKIHWFLRSGSPMPGDSLARYQGYIGHLYKNELYSALDHKSSFRSFGIPGWLKQNVFLVIEPKEFDGLSGAYPNDSRTHLLLGGAHAGLVLPIAEWSQEFAENLPGPIVAKVSEHFSESSTITDERWKSRLQERFGHLWKITKPVANQTGAIKIKPVQPAQKSKARNENEGGGGVPSRLSLISNSTNTKRSEMPLTGFTDVNGMTAAERRLTGGLPNAKISGKDDFNEDDAWVIARWVQSSAAEESHLLINQHHPVIKRHIQEIQRSYIGDEDEIAKEVIDVYGNVAIAHVAHSEYMNALMPSRRDVDEQLRSDASLTMALLGMWPVEAILLPRLAGKMAKRKLA